MRLRDVAPGSCVEFRKPFLDFDGCEVPVGSRVLVRHSVFPQEDGHTLLFSDGLVVRLSSMIDSLVPVIDDSADVYWRLSTWVPRVAEIAVTPRVVLIAASGGAEHLEAFLRDPNAMRDDVLFDEPGADAPARLAALRAVLDSGGKADSICNDVSALKVAIAFGHDSLEQLLLSLGAADADAAAWRFRRLRARLTRRLRSAPEVRAAWLAQLVDTTGGGVSPPLLALAVDGPLSSDPLRGMPATDPMIGMLVGDDAVSRLIAAGVPFFQR